MAAQLQAERERADESRIGRFVLNTERVTGPRDKPGVTPFLLPLAQYAHCDPGIVPGSSSFIAGNAYRFCRTWLSRSFSVSSSLPIGFTRLNLSRSAPRQVAGLVASMASLPPIRITV